jgi:hypothetical protein
VRSNRRFDQFDPVRLEPLEGSRLVQFHQAAVAGDVGGENGGELAFHERAPLANPYYGQVLCNGSDDE